MAKTFFYMGLLKEPVSNKVKTQKNILVYSKLKTFSTDIMSKRHSYLSEG